MNKPYGLESFRSLCDLESDLLSIRISAQGLPRIKLNYREISDFELIVNGGFSPLTGFMNDFDYNKVVDHGCLANGLLWPLPITLNLSDENYEKIRGQEKIALLHPDTETTIAIMSVESLYKIRKADEALRVFGTQDKTHPSLQYLEKQGSWAVGGKFLQVHSPSHYDFSEIRFSPKALREKLAAQGVSELVAFQTRNPMHRAHYELTLRAMKQVNGHLLLHPVVGPTKPGDIDHFVRVRCYKKIIEKYPKSSATLSLLPLAMRMAGPKEALLHMIIRKNYGATHFIVGRDHAGPGIDSSGKPFYDPSQAQKTASANAKSIGIEVLPFNELLYSEKLERYVEDSELPPGSKVLSISGTDFRSKLRSGQEIPEWFSFPEVVSELRRSEPSLSEKGLCLFFTGFSGSGKTTLSYALIERLKSLIPEPITLLDGDEVRTNLSKGLGFSKEDRDTNIIRIGYVASLVVKHRGLAICAPIAPYDSIRKQVRSMVSNYGHFVQIYVSTSIEDCERRDPKGLYADVRKGKIKNFTGIDDPYEAPVDSEIVINTTEKTVSQCLDQIIQFLVDQGYIRI